MEFKRIEYFLAVAKHLNFAKAAKELYITPQALSKQIKELEAEVGYPLLYRTTAKVKLTEGGESMKKRFTPLIDKLNKAWDETVSEKIIRFTYFGGIPQAQVVSKVIQEFTERISDCNFALYCSELEQVRKMMLDGEADLALTVCHPGEIWEDCNIVSILKLPAYVLMTKDNVLAGKKSITKADLKRTNIVLLKQDFIFNASMYGELSKSENVVYANTARDIMQLVSMGEGVAVMPLFDDGFEDWNLAAKKLSDKADMDFNVSIIYKKNNVLSKQFMSVAKKIELST